MKRDPARSLATALGRRLHGTLHSARHATPRPRAWAGWRTSALALLPGLALAAALALPGGAARGQSSCPAPSEVAAASLFGVWHAEFEGITQGATLMLDQHPEWTEGLAGTIDRNGWQARVSAELEDGEFVLEESSDGQRIAAVWSGAVVPGSCGREIRGQWQPDGGGAGAAFILKKAGGRD